MTTTESVLERGIATRTMLDGTAQVLTCRCGQDLDLTADTHCPRCGTCLDAH
jgi:predicted amidophosphoribosyltransferase